MINCICAAVTMVLVGALAVIHRRTVTILNESLTKTRGKLRKLENPDPVMYDLTDHGKIPIGNLSPVIYRGYKGIELKNKVAVASDLITNADNKNKFTLVIVTDKGIFVRTVAEKDSVLTKGTDSLKLVVKWKVYFGQSALMYSAFMVYKDDIMGFAHSRTTIMNAGDHIDATYTFDV